MIPIKGRSLLPSQGVGALRGLNLQARAFEVLGGPDRRSEGHKYRERSYLSFGGCSLYKESHLTRFNLKKR